MIHTLTISGKSLSDFGAVYDGSAWFTIPQRKIEKVSVPGRNGDVIIENDAYENMIIAFPTLIRKNFRTNYTALTNYLLSLKGYHRIESDEQPDVYRMGALYTGITPEMGVMNRHGVFDITFDFKPQKWLKSGEAYIDMPAGTTKMMNPTVHAAKPLILVQGTGTISFGGLSAQLTANTGETTIDCDTMNCFEGVIDRNSNLILSGDIYPELLPGQNDVVVSGFTKVKMKPRWWEL